MEFKQYAAREVSAVVSRTVDAVSEKSVRDLQAVRHALDMVAGAVDTVLAGRTAPDYADAVATLTDRLGEEATALAQAACEEARRDAGVVVAELRQALDTRTAENNDLMTSLAQARTHIEQLRTDFESQKNVAEAARAEAARVEETRAKVEAERRGVEESLAQLRAERDREAARAQQVTAELEAATRELHVAEKDRQDLTARLQTSGSELRVAAEEVREKERTCQALAAKLDAAASATATLRQRVETAERDTTRVRADAELAAQSSVRAARALQDAEASGQRRLMAQAEDMQRHATTFLSVSLDRLVAMYVSIASSATVDAVLAAVVGAMAVQFSRVALFRVQSNHLEGVRQVGFDLHADISQVLIPRTLHGLVTHAVTSGRIETGSADDLGDNGAMPFGGSPDFALALPIIIDGEPMAVVYADDSDQPHREFATADVRLKYAQLLQCHAVPLLTQLAAEARAVAELEEYATVLFDELQHTYSSEAASTSPGVEGIRRQRLRENIEYARHLYAQRAAGQGNRAASLFEDRLLAAAEAHADTVFGHDLAALGNDGDMILSGDADPSASAPAAGRAGGATG